MTSPIDDVTPNMGPVTASGDRQGLPYEAPRVETLGTLAELTRGGSIGPDDGLGGAGSTGSLP